MSLWPRGDAVDLGFLSSGEAAGHLFTSLLVERLGEAFDLFGQSSADDLADQGEEEG